MLAMADVRVKTNIVFLLLILMTTIVTSAFVPKGKRGGGGGGGGGQGDTPCVNSCRSGLSNGNMARCLRLSCRKHVFRYYMRIGKRQGPGKSSFPTENDSNPAESSMDEDSNIDINPFLRANAISENEFPHFREHLSHRQYLQLLLLLQHQQDLRRRQLLIQEQGHQQQQQQQQQQLQEDEQHNDQEFSTLQDTAYVQLANKMHGYLERQLKRTVRNLLQRALQKQDTQISRDAEKDYL